jgi:hypothetical protein
MKVLVLLGLVSLLVAAGCTSGADAAHPQTPEFTEFAQCITTSGTLMYGSFTCLSCKKQRESFGATFSEITEIECHPNGENPQVELCLQKDIAKTPTWIREVNGQETGRLEGFQSYEALAALSGCTYPGPQK